MIVAAGVKYVQPDVGVVDLAELANELLGEAGDRCRRITQHYGTFDARVVRTADTLYADWWCVDIRTSSQLLVACVLALQRTANQCKSQTQLTSSVNALF